MLDSLSAEQVMEAQTEEECAELARLLPPTEAALLDWAVNLMADVVQFEHQNKMNARNVAMVFAPNMTQVSKHFIKHEWHYLNPFSELQIGSHLLSFSY